MKRKLSSLIIITTLLLMATFSSFTNSSFAANSNNLQGETPSGIPLSQIEEEIDNYVNEYIGKTTPGAAIAVVKDGEIIFSKGYGYSDIENQILVDSETTIFEWGSTTKLFTWTSVMQLVEQGKLDLDEDIKSYLPKKFADKLNYKDAITMRNIMNHTAGFGDYGFDLISVTPETVLDLEDALLSANPKQYIEVGTGSAYSNYSVALAGYVIETISEKSYSKYLQENLFDVLDMPSTTADPRLNIPQESINLKAQGYLPDGKDGFIHSNWSYVSLAPAGSINGTVNDLAKFAVALTPGENEKSLLFSKPDTLKTMLTPTYLQTSHGFFEYNGEYQTFGHGGNTAAFSTQFAFVPDQNFGLAIVTNAGHEMDILFGVHELLLGKKDANIVSTDASLPPSSDVAGKYIPLRRQEGNFLDFLTYLGTYNIEATGINEITLTIGTFEGKFAQTKPYYYEIANQDTPLFNNMFPVLKFEVKGGKVTQITAGHGTDLSPIPSSKSTFIQIVSVLTIIISLLFFVTGALYLIISKTRNRKKDAPLDKDLQIFNRSHATLITLGLITLVNNLACILRIFINKFRTFAEMKPHVLLNYPLLLITIVTIIYSVYQSKKVDISSKRKVAHAITIILLLAINIVLIHWNFFAIVS